MSNQKARHGVAGCGAAILATSITHPIDVIKVRLQGQSVTHTTSSAESLRSLMRTTGARGLYAGLVPNVLGNAVAWGGYFYLYSYAKESWSNIRFKSTVLDERRFRTLDFTVCATLAGVAIQTLTNPIWVIKTRMILNTVSHQHTYSRLSLSVKAVFAENGIRGFFAGYVPGLFGVSHGVVQFVVYEQLKRAYRRVLAQRGTVVTEQSPAANAAAYFVAGAAAKIVATIATYPYQVIRTRLQAQSLPGIAKYSTKLRHLCLETWRSEGVRGFYRGLMPGVVRVTPHAAIVFAGYEAILRLLNSSDERRSG